jgi:hypothetical protein
MPSTECMMLTMAPMTGNETALGQNDGRSERGGRKAGEQAIQL